MSDRDWSWSIKPLVMWLKWLGVNISNGSQSNTSRCFVLYSISCLLLSVFCQVFCLYYIFKDHKRLSSNFVGENGFNSDTFALNMVSDFSNFAVHGLGCHIILLFFFSGRWILLVEAFQELESILSTASFIRVRRTAVMGVCWIIIVHAVLCFLNAFYHICNGSPFLFLCCSLVSVVSQVYPITAIVLFMVVSYASSTAYQSILCDLNVLKNRPMDRKHYNALLSLKRHHVQVCETIDHINNCFGWILGISLLFHFVSIINASFYFFGNERRTAAPLLEQFFFLSQILHTLLICYPPDMIHEKANAVLTELVRMQIKMEEPHKSLANTFAFQVDHFSPEVTAIGFYPINRKIIPQMVRTTLTYVIILYQFHSSEKK